MAAHANLRQACLPTCRFIHRFCNPRRGEGICAGPRQDISRWDIAIFLRNLTREVYTENSGYPEKIFNRHYLYNYIDQDILLEYYSDFHYNISTDYIYLLTIKYILNILWRAHMHTYLGIKLIVILVE